MTTYLAELDNHIGRFFNILVALNARWVNKPKFHMLVHLQDSIQRFGPASLFATEKFESFNGVVRHASVHSNHHSPGQDIANTFNTRLMTRLLISGSSFFDEELQTRVFGGRRLRQLLLTVPELYQALGLDPSLGEGSSLVIGCLCEPQSARPNVLSTTQDFETLKEYQSINLARGQKVEVNDFVLLKTTGHIGRVQSIWKPSGKGDRHTLVVLKSCQLGRALEFYGMHELVVTDEAVCRNIQQVDCMLDVQHNCHEAQCPVTKNHCKRIEHQTSSVLVSGVQHVDTNSFVLNCAAQYSSEKHRRATDCAFYPVDPLNWTPAIQEGLQVWHDEARGRRHGGEAGDNTQDG